jgi:hypothetical protein
VVVEQPQRRRENSDEKCYRPYELFADPMKFISYSSPILNTGLFFNPLTVLNYEYKTAVNHRIFPL